MMLENIHIESLKCHEILKSGNKVFSSISSLVDIRLHEPLKSWKSESSGAKDASSCWLQGIPSMGENK